MTDEQRSEQVEMACMALQYQIDNLKDETAALRHRVVLLMAIMGLGALWLTFS